MIVDVDGTVVRGSEPIEGANAGLETIDRAGLSRLFVSNNPTKPPSAYVDRLGSAGITVREGDVLTAGVVTVEYLREHYPDDRLFVIGEPGVITLLRDAGFSVTSDPSSAEVLVASVDYDFDYDDMRTALQILSEPSVAFVGTDPDVVIPAADGDVPGTGAILHAIEGVTGREPDAIAGKPSEFAASMAFDRLGVDPSECLVVGDRLDTDVRLGSRTGATTALVRTGVTDRKELSESSIEPDFVLDSIADIDRILSR